MKNFKDKTHKMTSNQKGFSLLEVAIAIAVIGILSAAFLAVLMDRYQKQEYNEHFQNVAEISEKLKDYAIVNGAYPLPADPTLAPGDANYGVSLTQAQVSDYTTGVCDGGHTVNGVTCTLGVNATGNGSDGKVVYIGAVPSSVLGYSSDESQDMHGTIYTYAVSALLTDPATFRDGIGQIQILSDETDTDAAGSNSDVHFVVVSHGENHSSPYTTGGTTLMAQKNDMLAACAPSCPSGFQPLEGEEENLDNDAVFWVLTAGVDGVSGSTNAVILNAIYDMNGPQYFDDAVGFRSSIFGREWTARGTDNVNMTMTLRGLEEGNGRILVGANSFNNPPNYTEKHYYANNSTWRNVKYDDDIEYSNGHGRAHDHRPQLWVDGSLKADQALSERICNQYQTECFKIDDIAEGGETIPGKSLRCIARGLKEVKIKGVSTNINAGKVGAGSEADGTCEVNTRVASSFTFGSDDAVTCPRGARGFDSDGMMICK